LPKTKSPTSNLDPADIESLKKTLVTRRQEVLALYEHDVRVGQESTDDNADDFADRANNSYNRETMFALSNNEREILISIDDAFLRMEKGAYGLCDYCDEVIGLPRLEAVPWARYCIRCQEREEQGLLD
jgi:DnaK suppressor protein